MKTLLFDIENTPLISYTWGLYEQNVVAVHKDWELLSVAYSWHGSRSPIKVIDREGQATDRRLTQKLWELLNHADVVVAHNAAEFDVKKAMAKFAEHHLGPPAPFKVIDTLKIARSQFKFTSNKLDDLAKLGKISRKLPNVGIEMWLGCMAGKASSWMQMRKYNKQDIVVLREVYEWLAPFAKSLPNAAIGKGVVCPRCGGMKLHRRGTVRSVAASYAQYQCVKCGGWTRSRLGERLESPAMLVAV